MTGGGGSVNGYHFSTPQAPPVTSGEDTYDGKCTDGNRYCTHQANVKLGNTVQFVLASPQSKLKPFFFLPL